MPTSLDVTTLENIAARGWQGTSNARVGEWLLRAGGGFTSRANSVLPLGSAGCDLDAALHQIADFYACQRLPAKIQLPLDEPGSTLHELDLALQIRGWCAFDLSVVMITPLAVMLGSCPPSATLPAASLESVPSPGWLAGYHYRGKPLPASAIEVLINANSPIFASVRAPGGDHAAVGRGVVTDGWLGVTAVTVAEQHRRSGFGRHMMGELGRWAAGRSAQSVYLQVDSRNVAALAMYKQLGFLEHHRYHYLAGPQA